MKASLSLFAALVLLSTCGPVLADARQDVLTAVQRCGAIADARIWLDCYYGAAQPMRGQLGLPSAPLSQQQIVPPASANALTSTLAMNPPKKKDFWDKLWSADAPPVVNKVTMREYHFDKRGAFSVTLVNGQIWREDPREHPLAGWHDKASNYVVSVEPSDNGYRMHIVGDLNTYAVQRVS